MKQQREKPNNREIKSTVKLAEVNSGLEVTFGEFQSKDLSFILIKLKSFFGFLSGLELFGIYGAWPSNCRSDSARGGGIGIDIIWMNVSVEAMEKESWDLEEGEEERERDCKHCVQNEIACGENFCFQLHGI